MSFRARPSRLIGAAVAVVLVMAALPLSTVAAQTEPDDGAGTPAEMVVPLPGSKVATPETQVTFRGATSGPIADLEVVGDVTGSHGGAYLGHSDGGGVSFVPSAPFSPGEQVTVTSPSALGVDVERSFTIARPGDQSLVARVEDEAVELGGATPAGPSAPPFFSRPDIASPRPTYTTAPASNGAGYLLGDALSIGPNPFGFPVASPAVWLVDDTPEAPDLVWSGGDPLAGPGNLRVEAWDGEPVLVWAEASAAAGEAGVTSGEWVVVDEHYVEVARLRPVGFDGADNHDAVFEDAEKSVSFIIYDAIDRRSVDPTALAGETVIEGVIQRIDRDTGAVLFEWHSTDHVPLGHGLLPDSNDYFHANSLARLPDGSYLLSARNTSGVYNIDATTGAVNWTLGGNASDFTFSPPGSGPSFQHDARLWSDGTIGIFNNGTTVSAADRYSLDFSTMTATRAAHRRHSPDLFGLIIGSHREGADGSSLVSWGSAPVVTEYDAGGSVVVELALGALSYRVVRDEWVGSPLASPDAVVRAEGSAAAAYVSWNGATEVASWRASVDDGPLGPTVAKEGFETRIEVAADACDVVVVGFDAGGTELGRSDSAAGLACSGVPQGVVMHRPFGSTDRYLDGVSVHDVDLSGAPEPVVGDFFTDGDEAVPAGAGDVASNGDEILWYAPGSAPDAASSFDGGWHGTNEPTGEWSGAIAGNYLPLVGDFDGSGCDDIFWYAAGGAPDYLWLSSCQRPGPGETFNSAFTSYRKQVVGSYEPFVGRFHNCRCESIFWYAPGTVRESIWTFGSDGRLRVNQPTTVNGSYLPIVVNPIPNGSDRIIWYEAGSGVDYQWSFVSLEQFTPAGIFTQKLSINGNYVPVVVDGGGYLIGSDRPGQAVLWYAPGRAADHVWTAAESGAFTSTPVTAPDGIPLAAPLGGCDGADSVWFHMNVRAGEAGTIWHPDGASIRTVETQFSGDGRLLPLGLVRGGCI